MVEIDSDEQILRTVRKHWFALLGNFFFLAICLLFPLALFFALPLSAISSLFAFSGSPVFAESFFLLMWMFIVWMIGWMLWTNYYLSVFVITDKRIFTIEQNGLFHHDSSSFRLDRIQDITVDQNGIIQTVLGFGTIHLETASEDENFIGIYIPNPYDLKKFINERQDTALDKSQLVHTDNTGGTPTPSAPSL